MLKYLLLGLFLLTAHGKELPETQTLEMKNWMGQMAPQIQNHSITEIFIPGSHDSATYHLEQEFGKNQDISNQLNSFKYAGVGFAITKVAYSWSRAQGSRIYDQLNNGVRYLDLRVIWRDSKKAFYTVHGLYGPSLDDVLGQIVQFLKENPKEILVIQIGDLRYMGQNANQKSEELAKKLQDKFGDKLIKKSAHGLQTTIQDIWKGPGRIFLIFNHNKQTSSKNIAQTSKFWQQSDINSYWANADNLAALKKNLDSNLRNRNGAKNQLFVIQSQLTSSDQTIKNSLKVLSKGYKSLEDMAKDVRNQLPKWLSDWRQQGSAIVLLDFATKETSQQIVALNKDLSIKSNPTKQQPKVPKR
jgi:hypothetical protein